MSALSPRRGFVRAVDEACACGEDDKEDSKRTGRPAKASLLSRRRVVSRNLSVDQLIVTFAQLDHADAPLALTERTE